MLFDSSLRRDLSRTFGATLVIILTIVLTMMLIRTLGLAATGRISPRDVALALGYFATAHLPTMLSLSLFITVVATLSRMYRDSEMTIWFASGAGLWRFVRPVLSVSWPVVVVVALLALFVWPWVNQRSTELRERFEQRSDLSRVAPGQFQTSRDGQKVFFIERASPDGRTGRNVFILTQQKGSESVTSARSGHIENQENGNFLVLEEGQRNEQNTQSGENTISRFQNYRILVGERAARGANTLPPKARRSIELARSPEPAARGELAWRVGLALGACNLLLLGVGLSATNPRRASNWNLLFALLTFVVYFNLINLTKAWVANGKLDVGSALLLTHGLAFMLALGLIWWRDHGAHASWRQLIPSARRAAA